MHTDNKKPTGDGNPPAGHIDGEIVPNMVQRIKSAFIRFASWLSLMFRGVA